MLGALFSAAKIGYDLYSGYKQSKAYKKAAQQTKELAQLQANRQLEEDTKTLASQKVGMNTAGVSSNQDIILESLKNRKINYIITKKTGEQQAAQQSQAGTNTLIQTATGVLGDVAQGYRTGVWKDFGFSSSDNNTGSV